MNEEGIDSKVQHENNICVLLNYLKVKQEKLNFLYQNYDKAYSIQIRYLKTVSSFKE